MAFKAYGVRVRVTADQPEVQALVPGLLPPGAEPWSVADTDESFGIITDPDGTYRFERGDSLVTKGIDLEFALQLLETQLRMYVGLNAPDMTFVHAGVAEHGGHALVLPGLSFSGKTRLVLALTELGATYYSDEFAVIDREGLVHPFPKALSIRDDQELQVHQTAERLGATVGTTPIRIGAVVFTEYRTHGVWDPKPLSPGRGLLSMLAHTLGARSRSEEAMQTIKQAIDGVVLLESERGEADEVASRMLDLVTV